MTTPEPGTRICIPSGIPVIRKGQTTVRTTTTRARILGIVGDKVQWDSQGHVLSETDISNIPDFTGVWPRLTTDQIQGIVKKTVESLVKVVQDRADAIQDIWIKVLEVRDYWSPSCGSEKRFLSAVVYRAGLDWLRRKSATTKRNREVREDDLVVDATWHRAIALPVTRTPLEAYIVRQVLADQDMTDIARDLGVTPQYISKVLEELAGRPEKKALKKVPIPVVVIPEVVVSQDRPKTRLDLLRVRIEASRKRSAGLKDNREKTVRARKNAARILRRAAQKQALRSLVSANRAIHTLRG